jgi:opacity protein-like surface antigen
MRSFKTFAAIGALVLSFGAAARAADFPRSNPSMPLPPPIVQRAPSLVEEFSSGWYLRGDVGYRFDRLGGVSNAAPIPTFDDKLANTITLGLGVGYKWQWFRTDLTADYAFKARYTGSTAALAPDFGARIDGTTALANIYGDLGTWFGLTPYIGVGAGGAYLRTSDFNRGFTPFLPAVRETGRWNLAWAWMAGVSYKVSQNYQIDLGYRHVSLGSANTGTDAFGNQLTFKRLSGEEIRVGVRYLID